MNTDTSDTIKAITGSDCSDHSYQDHVRAWVVATFGHEVANNINTRCWRFFEEAGELVQALGMTKEDALKLVEYTWGRPAGEPVQEMGGVMVTLAALATPAGILMREAGYIELVRCWQNMDKIRAKQQSKAKLGLGESPLPGTSDLGKFVTLQIALGLPLLDHGDDTSVPLQWVPQLSVWKILGEESTNAAMFTDGSTGYTESWRVEHVPDVRVPEKIQGWYALPKHSCTKPRDTVV